jgi:hypothetical protein
MQKYLFNDHHFKNGFKVIEMERPNGQEITAGVWNFPTSTGTPQWQIDQWYSKYCLWHDRAESDALTLSDGKTKWLKYDVNENSLTMRLNAKNVYEGRAAGNELWPHLLIEQELKSLDNIPEKDRAFYADFKKLELSLDIRMPDFKDTTNPDGINACQFFAYFYLTLKDRKNFVWFGVNLFDSRGLMDTYWHIDTVGTEMIYILSTADTYGGAGNSFYVDGVKPTNEWKRLRLDLTPYVDKVVALANRDNTFGRQVSRNDFYIRGNNLGFEIHGNFDCTFEIKNYTLISTI